MPDLDVSAELALAAQLADAARPIALQHFRTGLHVDAKPAHEFDPVTEADRAIEARIRAILAESRPADGVLGEEQAETLGQRPIRQQLPYCLVMKLTTRWSRNGLATWLRVKAGVS